MPASLPTLAEVRSERQRRADLAAAKALEHDEAAVRARCVSLVGFVREAWHIVEPGVRYVHNWHIDAICQHLEAITWGTFLGLNLENRLAINIPPRCMKSLIVGVFWPAWEWGPAGKPWLRYLTASWNEDFAVRDARKMRDLVESAWYQRLWGATVQLVRRGEASFANTAGGGREATTSVGMTGEGGHRVIWDDPHSTEKAESDPERARTIRVFRESLTTRLNDPVTSAVVIVMQRLHDGDVCGTIDKLKMPYVRLILPMELELERRCVTQIGFKDPRTAANDLLFPERFPRNVVERDKQAMGSYAAAGQYQQRPSPRGGGMFKREWFTVVPAAPAGVRWVRGWDLAASTTSTSPFSCGVKFGRDNRGVFYVGDVRRLRGSDLDVEKAIIATASQDGKECEISIPQDPGQAGKMQARYLVSRLAGYRIYSSPETGDKETRAQPVSAQAEAGNVNLVRGAWNEVFLDEVTLFPNSDYKDQVDGLSRAFGRIIGKGSTKFVVPLIATRPREQ